MTTESKGDRPTVVSLFAGGGGSSLGFRDAGFRELLAVEWDAYAAETFRDNFPGVPVHEGDVTLLTGEEALRTAGVGPGELDVLDGSPPCQGFSTSGKRRLWDPRNELYLHYVRLLEAFRPRAMVMENVSGLARGMMRVVLVDILKRLRGAGYRVSARLLNAKFFGVPQQRERLIFVGVREDLGIEPSHPQAATRPIGVRQALAGVEPVTHGPPLSGRSRIVWAQLNPGQRGIDLPWTAGGWWDWNKVDPRRPSRTVTAMPGTMLHWQECRPLSSEEVARLMGFPDDFVLHGPWRKRWHVLGNSVPPPLMRAVAEHVRGLLVPAEAVGAAV